MKINRTELGYGKGRHFYINLLGFGGRYSSHITPFLRETEQGKCFTEKKSTYLRGIGRNAIWFCFQFPKISINVFYIANEIKSDPQYTRKETLNAFGGLQPGPLFLVELGSSSHQE